MQNKGALKFLAIVLAIACAYQLSFTFVTRHVEKQAARYAAGDPVKEQNYLDSVKSQPVYNLGFVKFNYKECKEKEINLGLDLRGGMNVMLEISVEDVVRALSNDSKDPVFNQALAQAREAQKSSTSDYITLFASAYEKVSDGGKLCYIFNTPELREVITPASTNEQVIRVLREQAEGAIANSFNVLRNRIDRFGVAQPNIQRLENSGRILVELPGVKEPERVRKLLQGTASLEFWATYENNEIYPALEQANALIRDLQAAGSLAGATDSVAKTTAEAILAADSTVAKTEAKEESSLLKELDSLAPQNKPAAEVHDTSAMSAQYPLFAKLQPIVDQQGQLGAGPVVGHALSFDTATVNRYLNLPQVKALLPRDVKLLWGIKASDPGETIFDLYAIKANTRDGKAPLDGGVVTEAREEYSQHGASAEVSMVMNAAGARSWARLTADNIGRSVAIVLDGYVYSAPRVNQEIEGGRSSITGNFTIQEAKDLANVLKSGKLPAPARIIQDTVVGPSLGQESINAGMMSFILAFILVLIYMIFYYNTAGLVAGIALICNLFFLLGVLVSFGAVLTLPGIAGIILSIGMAVDANVIIFARIREEIATGKTVNSSMKIGFKKAMSAILDGNITTIIAALVLIALGSGTVKGFAYTLMIGIVLSMFTALVVTRWILYSFYAIGIRDEKFYGRAKERRTLNFLGKRGVFFAVSLAMIAAGFIGMGVHAAKGSGALNYGLDFVGGTSTTADYGKDYTIEEIENTIVPVVADVIGDNDIMANKVEGTTQITVKTRTLTLDERDTLEQALVDQLGADESSITSQSISSTVSNEMRSDAIVAVIVASICMLIYIWFRFKDIRFGASAIIALLHDVLVVLAVYSLLRISVGNTFIACMLTIIGYSVNDTIVIFDRIRENLGRTAAKQTPELLAEVANKSLTQTLSRSINTSLTTFIMVFMLFLLGVASIREFALPLMAGLLCGAYSSICIATELWYIMRLHLGKNRLIKK